MQCYELTVTNRLTKTDITTRGYKRSFHHVPNRNNSLMLRILDPKLTKRQTKGELVGSQESSPFLQILLFSFTYCGPSFYNEQFYLLRLVDLLTHVILLLQTVHCQNYNASLSYILIIVVLLNDVVTSCKWYTVLSIAHICYKPESKTDKSRLSAVVRLLVSYLLTPVAPSTFDLLATDFGVSEV